MVFRDPSYAGQRNVAAGLIAITIDANMLMRSLTSKGSFHGFVYYSSI